MEKEILQVRMLGGFSMVYQEKTLVFDRNYISKSTQLLQILFLHLEKGIAKERLLEELYGRDDVENRNGSLNIYDFPVEKAAGGGRSARRQVFLPEKRNLLLGFRDPCGDRPLCF